ncbi:hypothetical protein ADN00_05770 [Ornatilinea apprima]|uniref:ABC transporter substrate-binding protein n=1 Tax=Ornatilinea apprima TaxID=1134406 RepID=A0A0P6X6R3_9CHLR|nr:sugar ABC transporter substrate-binding protein [Ornatilinea apprima]KPL78747.1 hypothetical protein ADN00_05770 [Ornatilinea apprima]
MKRSIYFVSTIVIVLAMLLAGCQQPPAAEPAAEAAAPTTAAEAAPAEATAPAEPAAPAETPVTIRALIRPDEGENVATYAAKFEEMTGNKVVVDFASWAEIHDKTITTLATGGGGYDIIFIPSANVVEFSSGGWFEPINDLITDANRGEWLESVVDMYTIDGDLIAMPWYAGGAHMAYNAAVLEAAGVDPASIVTWDDFMAACRKIKETGAAEFCFSPSAKYPGNFYYNWGTMVLSNGSEFFDEEGAPIFADNDAAVKSLQMIKTGIDEGLFDPAGIALDDYETLIAFGTGKIAFMLNSTWSVTQAAYNADLSTVMDDANLMLIPGNGDVRSAGYLYAGGLGLLKTSENKEVAKEFLVFLTSEEAQKHHAINGANLPTRLSLYEDADIAAAWRGFDVLAQQLTYGEFPPQFGWFEEWRRSAATAVQDVMANRKSPEDAISWLVAETNRIREQ